MLSPRALSRTQDEIQTRVTSHANTLVELFRVTGAFVAADQHGLGGLGSTKSWALDENAFLIANDLHKGRIFDFSTLPLVQEPTRADIIQSSPSPQPTDSHLEQLQTHTNASSPASHIPSEPPEHSAAPAPKKPRLEAPSLERFDAGTIKLGSISHGAEIPNSSVSPETTPPITSTQSTITAPSTLPEPLPSTHANGLQDANHGEIPEAVQPDTQTPGSTQVPESEIGEQHLAVAKSDQHPTTEESKSPVQPEPDLDLTLADAPATPGAQLRFEEAQSIRNEQIGSPERDGPTTDSIAQEVHDETLAQGDSMNDGSILTNAISAERSQVVKSIEGATGAFGFGRIKDAATEGIRNPAFAGTDESLTLSQRPPMRIDTGIPVDGSLKSAVGTAASTGRAASNQNNVAQASQPETPLLAAAPTPTHARRDRMTTRVSSGALGRKSVSEILGETPRTATFSSDKSERPAGSTRKDQGQERSIRRPMMAGSPPQPLPASFRFPDIRERDRIKLPTVVFQGAKSTKDQDLSPQVQKEKAKHDPANDDFLMPLFITQAVPPQTHSLHHLAYTNHKALSTSDSRIDQDEQLNVRLLSRIYQLQNGSKWALRQFERSQEPSRPVSHWDHLLDQMKWMRTDYKEERKWKMAAAHLMAVACADWFAASKPARAASQTIASLNKDENGLVRARLAIASESTPDLIPSTEDDPTDVEDMASPSRGLTDTVAPAAIFSLPPDMFVFGMAKNDASDKILSELPLYEPSTASLTNDQAEVHDPDKVWRKPIVPLSKHVEGKLSCQLRSPVYKRRRFDNDESTRLLQDSHEISRPPPSASIPDNDHPVALFDPVNKPTRERIQLNQAFRPPSEHPMPSQGFFQSRTPSQWTQNEDDDLRRYVREYAYNWSFISACLSIPSRFLSGAERRTPWECFERWKILEGGLPTEFQKVPYFRSYENRLQAAQRNYEAQEQGLRQQQQQNGNSQVPMRRRSNQPYLVERRRNNKHIYMFEAMRQLHKKKEAARAKQEHVAETAAMRKAQEPKQPRTVILTPSEISQKKYEKQCYQEEQLRQYRVQVLNNQKLEAARRAQQHAQMNGLPNNASMNRVPQVPAMNGVGPNTAAALPNGQSSAAMAHLRGAGIPTSSRLANGVSLNASTSGPQNVPHAPMQPLMQMSQRVPSNMSNDMNRYHEAARQQADQQKYLIQQRLQQPQGNQQPGKSASPNMANMSSAPHNPSMYAPMQNGRAASPAVNGNYPSNAASASPRIGSSQPQPLSSGMVPIVNQMQNHVRNSNPGASPEQIKALTTEAMNSQYRLSQAQQAALQAVPANNIASMVGGSGINGIASSLPTQQAMMNGTAAGQLTSSQQYAALIRQQQQQQQQQQNQHNRTSGAGMGNMRPGSRGGTPQMHPGGTSQSPRPSSAQAVSGQ